MPHGQMRRYEVHYVVYPLRKIGYFLVQAAHLAGNGKVIASVISNFKATSALQNDRTKEPMLYVYKIHIIKAIFSCFTAGSPSSENSFSNLCLIWTYLFIQFADVLSDFLCLHQHFGAHMKLV